MVMLDMEKGLYYSLNPVASQIWTLIENPASVSYICDQLTADYEIPPHECEKEVIHFLTEMLEKGVVESVEHAD